MATLTAKSIAGGLAGVAVAEYIARQHGLDLPLRAGLDAFFYSAGAVAGTLVGIGQELYGAPRIRDPAHLAAYSWRDKTLAVANAVVPLLAVQAAAIDRFLD